jgi:hypothetical protein
MLREKGGHQLPNGSDLNLAPNIMTVNALSSSMQSTRVNVDPLKAAKHLQADVPGHP